MNRDELLAAWRLLNEQLIEERQALAKLAIQHSLGVASEEEILTRHARVEALADLADRAFRAAFQPQ